MRKEICLHFFCSSSLQPYQSCLMCRCMQKSMLAIFKFEKKLFTSFCLNISVQNRGEMLSRCNYIHICHICPVRFKQLSGGNVVANFTRSQKYLRSHLERLLTLTVKYKNVKPTYTFFFYKLDWHKYLHVYTQLSSLSFDLQKAEIQINSTLWVFFIQYLKFNITCQTCLFKCYYNSKTRAIVVIFTQKGWCWKICFTFFQ